MKPGEQDDLLKKFYNGSTSLEEEKQLLSLLKGDTENGVTVPEKDIAGFFENEKKVKSKVTAFNPPAAKKHLSLFLKIAASVLLAGALGWSLLDAGEKETRVAEQQTTSQEQKQVELPDGSRVTLNHNSSLKYPRKFAGIREVVLQGEAYFEVLSDEKRPFRVVTGNVTTEVLGTAFNLKWNQTLQTVELEVTEGKVAFSSFESELSERIFVNAGEHAVYTGKTKTIEKFEAFNPNLISWKTKRLVFENASLEKVLKDAASYFDIEFTTSSEALKKCNFSGTLDNPRLEDFLEALNYVLRIDHEITTNKIILMGNGC